MRANILVVLAVLLFGVGASLLLIPRGGELALQKFRDQDYESARAEYETRFANGDHSAATVIPLTKLNLADGDVEAAIGLMERFLAREPGSVEGRDLLSRLYRDAQRQGDYLENLRALALLRGTDEAFRELASVAGFQGRLDIQVEALTRYCLLRPDEVDTQQELAALLAARGDPAGAADWLMRADDRAKGNIQANGRELLMSLLIDLDRDEDAFLRAQRWLGESPTVPDMIGLGSQLSVAGRPDLALRLLEPQAGKPGRALGLELTVIDLQIATGRLEEARARLEALPGPVDDVSLGRLLALQMNAGMGPAALASSRGRDLRLIPDWVLGGLAEAAFRNQDRAFLDRLGTELGDAFLDDRPVLAANIALGRGDVPAAIRWAARGLADHRQPLGERLAAVRILDGAGRRGDALAGFDRLPFGEAVPEAALGELAALFLDLGRAPAGLSWFEARRRSAPSPAADHGWARLAARAGDPAAVVAWLDGQPNLPAALLQDIAGIAAERRAGPLALAAAERVFVLAPTPRSRLALASALLATGRAADALPHLTELLPGGGPEVEAAYVEALDATGRTDEAIRHLSARLARGDLSDADEQAIAFGLLDRKAYAAALPVLRARAERLGGDWLVAYADTAVRAGAFKELTALLDRQLADPKLDAAGREQRAQLLLEVAGPVHALPMLRQLALANGAGQWDSLYRETLAKLGRKDELRRYLLARAIDDRLAAQDRRGVASALLELGEKAGAEQALQRLAAGQGPQSDDFKQLLYLWGPRPPAAALDWIEARAKAAASADEQAAWYERLAELGGARRVAEGLGGAGTPPEAPALKTPYIEALAAQGKGKELAESVRSALATERSPDRLRRYARLAERVRERRTAAEAWTAVLSRKPDDAEALRQLGLLAYDENRLEDAERWLRRFVARNPDDYEAYYFLGESLTALKRPTVATPFYRTALAQLRAGRTRNDTTAQTEANLLNRLGQVDEAVRLLESLRKRRPGDRQLTADYASMLIENGRLQEARRVLSLR